MIHFQATDRPLCGAGLNLALDGSGLVDEMTRDLREFRVVAGFVRVAVCSAAALDTPPPKLPKEIAEGLRAMAKRFNKNRAPAHPKSVLAAVAWIEGLP